MTIEEQKALLADCVAFAIAHLRYPTGVEHPTPQIMAIDWRRTFAHVLADCGYMVSEKEQLDNNLFLPAPMANGELKP